MPCADSIPKVLIYNPQGRDIGDHPVLFGVQAGNPFAGIRVLCIGETVPDLLANIEFIVQDTCAAFTVAVKCRGTPSAPSGTWNSFGVQIFCNTFWRDACRIGLKDTVDDPRLYRINCRIPSHEVAAGAKLCDDPVSECFTPGVLACDRPPLEAAVGLGGKVFEEQ